MLGGPRFRTGHVFSLKKIICMVNTILFVDIVINLDLKVSRTGTTFDLVAVNFQKIKLHAPAQCHTREQYFAVMFGFNGTRKKNNNSTKPFSS